MENPVRKQRVKYETEEERRSGMLATFLRYASKPWTCDICHKTILRGNKSTHLRSKKHNQTIVVNN